MLLTLELFPGQGLGDFALGEPFLVSLRIHLKGGAFSMQTTWRLISLGLFNPVTLR